MNAERRKRIAEIADKIIGLKTDIEMLRDEEQDAFDNLPEGLQSSDRGGKMESAIEALDDAINSLEEVESSLETAKE